MELSVFINDLITTGRVSIPGRIVFFDGEDRDATAPLLQQLYRDAALDCPAPVPAFAPQTAFTAAKFLYVAIQLAVLREEGEDSIRQHLPSFIPENAADVFSADLVLCYVPQLIRLVKGLAPADILVEKLLETAAIWPLSSVGIELKHPANEDIILADPALKQLYADRIVEYKDKTRVSSAVIREQILESAGEHISVFWPGFPSS